MAQLRIRLRQPATSPWATMLTIVPMVGLLAIGALMTVFVDNGRDAPAEVFAALKPAVKDARIWTQKLWLSAAPLTFSGHDWIPAEHPVVVFPAAEMVIIGDSAGRTLYANQLRGLPELSLRPGPYDRPYAKLLPNTYAPLRWRHIP